MDQRGGGECFEAAIIGVTLAFLSAIAVAGYQIYVYLKHGTWLSISVVDGFLYITQPNFPAWLLFPDDWIGVHKVLENPPLGLGLCLMGLLWAFIVGYIGSKIEESRMEKTFEENRKEE